MKAAILAAAWVTAWYSPPFPPTAVWSCNQVRTFSHQTVRQVVQLEAAGDRVRIRLTNELGLGPLSFGEVHVALASPNGVTEPGTDRAVTFGGKPGATLPTGEALVSDPVDLKVRRFQDLAVSVYYPSGAAPAGHLFNLQISPPGDHAAEPVWPQAARSQAPGLVSGVEIQTGRPPQVLVAFGDSITEGACDRGHSPRLSGAPCGPARRAARRRSIVGRHQLGDQRQPAAARRRRAQGARPLRARCARHQRCQGHPAARGHQRHRLGLRSGRQRRPAHGHGHHRRLSGSHPARARSRAESLSRHAPAL